MESRATQTEIKVTNGKQLTSKDIQSSLDGDEVERLRDFHDKYWEKQLKLDVNLRWNGFCQIDLFFFLFYDRAKLVCIWLGMARRQIEDTFAVELSKSNEKIGKMNGEISLLQVSFRLMVFSVANLRVSSKEKGFI